jgi:hypothetical protein
MAAEMSNLEINRWNCDDQAIAEIFNAEWNVFFAEPRFGKDGVQSRKHKRWEEARRTLHHAIDHLRAHTPEWRLPACGCSHEKSAVESTKRNPGR